MNFSLLQIMSLNKLAITCFFQISLFISFLFSINLTSFTPKPNKVDMVAFSPYIIKIS